MDNMEEKTYMIPDLLELTKTYFKYEIKGDVSINELWKHPGNADDTMNIIFVFESCLTTQNFTIIGIKLNLTMIPEIEKVITGEHKWDVRAMSLITCEIYSQNNYIYFNQFKPCSVTNDVNNGFKILKSIAIPVLEKLITLIKTHLD